MASNQVQLLQLLVRTMLPTNTSAQGQVLVERAAETLSVSAPATTPTLDGTMNQLEALLAHRPDRASRFQALRRKLVSAGSAGSGMAGYRDKAELLQLLLQLNNITDAAPIARYFSDTSSSALSGSAPSRQLAPASVDALAAVGALLPPWVEQALVRDLVFVLQGIDGTHINFDVDADAFVAKDVVDGYALPGGVRAGVAFLGELGWAHRATLRLLEVCYECIISMSSPLHSTALAAFPISGLFRRPSALYGPRASRIRRCSAFRAG